MNHSAIIYTDLQPVRRARKSDPATSHAAAAKAARFAKSHSGRILSAIQDLCRKDDDYAISSHGATAEDVWARTGLTVVQIDRRLHEMQKAGLIEVVQVGREDLTRNGFRCWRVV